MCHRHALMMMKIIIFSLKIYCSSFILLIKRFETDCLFIQDLIYNSRETILKIILKSYKDFSYGPVGWCCRRHRLHLCSGVRLPQLMSWLYDTKQSDGEAQAMLESWRLHSIPLWSTLPGPPKPGVVAPDRVLSMG